MQPLRSALIAVSSGLTAIAIVVAAHAVAGDEGDEVVRLRKQAATLLQAKRYADAAEALRQVDRLTQGRCAECLMELARTYVQLGAHKNAADTAERVIALHADETLLGPAYEMLATGLARRAAKDPFLRMAAEDAYRKAIEIGGGARPLAQYGLGVFLMQVGRDADGQAALATYLQLEPKGPHAAEAQRFIDDPGCAREECAPDFSVVTLDGQYLTLKELRGKVVVLEFWATWCQPCHEAMPALKHLAKAMAGEPFVMIGVSADHSREEASHYVDKEALGWPQVWDERGRITQTFGVSSFPTRLLINHDGRIVHRESAWNSRTGLDDLSSEARKALAAAKKALKARPRA